MWDRSHDQFDDSGASPESVSAYMTRGIQAAETSRGQWAAVLSMVKVTHNLPITDDDAAMRDGDDGPWAEGFIDWLRAGGVAADTIRVRRTYIRAWLTAHPEPEHATTADAVAWLSRDDWSAETKKVARSTIRSFYSWATQTGIIKHDPTLHTRAVSVPKALPRPARQDAIARALDAAEGPQRLAILLALLGGLRRAEIAALHSRDVEGDWIRVRGKGSKVRRVPIHADLREPLMAAARQGGYVFPSPMRPGEPISRSTVGNWISTLLGDGGTAHRLRHSFGTNVYRGTHDLRAVQRLLGHSSIATTERYVDVADDALLAAVSSL